MLIVFSNPFLFYLFTKNWDIDPATLAKGKVYSAVIVLGGFSGEDRNGNGFFNEQATRFVKGL